jgi:hypothetical protein
MATEPTTYPQVYPVFIDGEEQPGMTLLDYFAGIALSKYKPDEMYISSKDTAKKNATAAYEVASAMI